MATTEEMLKAILDRLNESTSEFSGRHDKHEQKLDALTGITIRQQAILEEHMRRTAANEVIIGELRTAHQDHVKDVNDRIEPLKQHVAMWGGVGKLLATLAALGTVASAIYKIFF